MMKKSIVAYTMAGVLGLVLGSAAWSCGCSTTKVVHKATVVEGTKTVVEMKPVYHKVKVKNLVLTPVTYQEPVRSTCGCGGSWFGLGGNGGLLW
jgi:hypothetical protein